MTDMTLTWLPISGIQEYRITHLNLENGDRCKRINEQAQKHKVTEKAQNYEFLNESADRRKGSCAQVNSGKEPKG